MELNFVACAAKSRATCCRWRDGHRPKTHRSQAANDYPRSDEQLTALADKLYGNGIITNQSARELLLARGVPPDFEWTNAESSSQPEIDFIHRKAADSEIYFVSNRSSNTVALNCKFRVNGLAPELWDPVSGEHHFATSYEEKEGRTALPLHFDPCGAWFVIFRRTRGWTPVRRDTAIGRRFRK